ncbi:MXAN_2562 family outer membrane beta-barrel protein [Pyxidicoccus xibeiensis]|uniref:MXAN_2562 family outer membrane beta-barrel protein n=1 Tax=Pyxidicoccus xibeiensis TaxID=2906759 RepID=UPI0020A7C088|nr:MXAN_2562 family outer membrane beta-barrel protein [Pyxidicoccus xibeiensis]MCP3141293.1 MXAN_2562 family outer membrane beta-barrel protein [Pyxidicoccus xibeiensis]
MSRAITLGVAALLSALPAWGQDTSSVTADEVTLQSPRSGAVLLRLGGYKPLVDEEPGLGDNKPYEDTFGDASLLLFEMELQRYFYQGIGTAGVGLSAGYAEKYAASRLASGGGRAAEQTALKVIPLGLNAFYKFDYAAFEWGIPLVPYGKLGLIYTPWWITKGDSTEVARGNKASGAKWGWGATGGLAFMLDVLEPRFARDFDSDLGVNHSYLFAEYTYADVDNFGAGGLVLSSRRWMFGLALDY